MYSRCREILPRIGLGIRTRACEICNTIHDRDVNASINILNAYMIPLASFSHLSIFTPILIKLRIDQYLK
ncbi:zinc ribbon domain-containing protein [Fluviispira multicolorata]|uniref:Transposase n=1 Tax=Fluviispira multicolorata TaxID=2654512 RepID=A0A833JEJ5_9BACT|nr:transposase [Fluviispira multicolorata]